MSYHIEDFVVKFYNNLVKKFAEEHMEQARIDLLGHDCSRKDWLEYCFSNESPY